MTDWQRLLEQRLVYIPWSPAGVWYNKHTPQEAWDGCPRGTWLGWVLSNQQTRDLTPLALDLAAWVHPRSELLIRFISEGATEYNRELLATQLQATPKEDTEIALADLPLWHQTRAVLSACLVACGFHARFHHIPYHAAALTMTHRQTADRVRSFFPKEAFTGLFRA